MNRDEAKLLLQVYRPNRDEGEPQFAEALEWLNRDPELAEWFAEEQAFDHVVREGLKAVPVPSNLKTAILTGEKVLNLMPWWRLVGWRRLAICTLVLSVASVFFLFSFQRTQNIVAFSRQMIEFSDYRMANLAVQTHDLKKIRAYFLKCWAPSDFQIPVRLRNAKVLGGTLVGFRDHTASVVCFSLAGIQSMRLFVISGIASEDLPKPGSMLTFEFDDWAAILWTDHGTDLRFGGAHAPGIAAAVSRRQNRLAEGHRE